MLYKINADFTLNVLTEVDTEEPPIENTQEEIKKQAIEQLMCKDFEIGDPVCDPKINWLECEEEDEVYNVDDDIDRKDNETKKSVLIILQDAIEKEEDKIGNPEKYAGEMDTEFSTMLRIARVRRDVLEETRKKISKEINDYE